MDTCRVCGFVRLFSTALEHELDTRIVAEFYKYLSEMSSGSSLTSR